MEVNKKQNYGSKVFTVKLEVAHSPWLRGLPLRDKNHKVLGFVAGYGWRCYVIYLLIFSHSLQDLASSVSKFTHLHMLTLIHATHPLWKAQHKYMFHPNIKPPTFMFRQQRREKDTRELRSSATPHLMPPLYATKQWKSAARCWSSSLLLIPIWNDGGLQATVPTEWRNIVHMTNAGKTEWKHL